MLCFLVLIITIFCILFLFFYLNIYSLQKESITQSFNDNGSNIWQFINISNHIFTNMSYPNYYNALFTIYDTKPENALITFNKYNYMLLFEKYKNSIVNIMKKYNYTSNDYKYDIYNLLITPTDNQSLYNYYTSLSSFIIFLNQFIFHSSFYKSPDFYYLQTYGFTNTDLLLQNLSIYRSKLKNMYNLTNPPINHTNFYDIFNS